MGVDRTLELVRSRLHWPRMMAEIERDVKTCDRCVKRKASPEKAALLVNIITTRPLELLCIDFLSHELDQRNIKDILVMTDNFTKYSIAVPTSN